MTIYQLHECGGEWEDHFDHIIGSYLRKERAEEEKAKAEIKEKQLVEHSNRCFCCPLLDFDWDFPHNLDELLAKHPDYCSEAKLSESGYGIDCENYCTHRDESSFYISEVEVEE